MSNQTIGVFSAFKPLTKDEEKIFAKALENHLGAKFTPESFSKQIVHGTNYRFIAKGITATHPAREFHAWIEVFVDTNQHVELKKIIDMSINSETKTNTDNFSIGGYIAHEQLTEQDIAVFNYAFHNMLGVDSTPLAVESQVVNGTNYRFVALSKVVVPYAQPKLVVIDIYTKFAHSVHRL